MSFGGPYARSHRAYRLIRSILPVFYINANHAYSTTTATSYQYTNFVFDVQRNTAHPAIAQLMRQTQQHAAAAAAVAAVAAAEINCFVPL